jgi:hypothetical protein
MPPPASATIALAATTAAPQPPSPSWEPRSHGSRRAIPGWAADLVTGAPEARWTSEGTRLAWAMALAACYGMALGARYGVQAMLIQAVGVPLALAAVAAVAGPAFYILLAHAGHPIRALGLAAALSRATATTGLVLAGIAPAAAMITVSTESPVTAAVYGMLGLLVGGGLGLRRLGRELATELDSAEPGRRFASRLVGLGFACFATVLAARVWWLAVPSLGGGY